VKLIAIQSTNKYDIEKQAFWSSKSWLDIESREGESRHKSIGTRGNGRVERGVYLQ